MNWKEENNTLERTFKFKSFIEAWSFMTKVAMVAEKMNHHPEWSNSLQYRKYNANYPR